MCFVHEKPLNMGSLYSIFLNILYKIGEGKVMLGDDLVSTSQLYPNLGGVLNLVRCLISSGLSREKGPNFVCLYPYSWSAMMY